MTTRTGTPLNAAADADLIVLQDVTGTLCQHLTFGQAHELITQLTSAAATAQQTHQRACTPFLTRWVVSTGVDTTILGSGTALVLASDEAGATRKTITKVLDESPLADARVDPSVQVVEVDQLERVTATATLQVWVRDYAVTLPGDPVTFDVTEKVVSMGRDAALALEDASEGTDQLYVGHDPQAKGPLFVTVEDAITDFFDQVPEGTLI